MTELSAVLLAFSQAQRCPAHSTSAPPAQGTTMRDALAGRPKLRIELPYEYLATFKGHAVGQGHEAEGTKRVTENYTFNAANQVGEGTYGRVFMGTCKTTGDKVALKKLKIDREEEGFPITAMREIKILSTLKHQNIVNLREIVRSTVHKDNNFRGSVYMVFDFCEHDLVGLVKNHRLSEGEVKCIMMQLLRGLHYMHENGVMHRDLKPGNILMDATGTIKLADFGLAKAFKNEMDGRFSPNVVTLWYRPPELLLGADRYGPEVDMWGVGCIMAELLTGTALFPGKKTDIDQRDCIFGIMGAPETTKAWPTVTQLPGWSSRLLKDRYPKGSRLTGWVHQHMAYEERDIQGRKYEVRRDVSREAVDLLQKLLTLNPNQRPTALEVMADPWFTSQPPMVGKEQLPCDGVSHEFTVKKPEHDLRRKQQHGQWQEKHQPKRVTPLPSDFDVGGGAGHGSNGSSGALGTADWFKRPCFGDDIGNPPLGALPGPAIGMHPGGGPSLPPHMMQGMVHRPPPSAPGTLPMYHNSTSAAMAGTLPPHMTSGYAPTHWPQAAGGGPLPPHLLGQNSRLTPAPAAAAPAPAYPVYDPRIAGGGVQRHVVMRPPQAGQGQQAVGQGVYRNTQHQH